MSSFIDSASYGARAYAITRIPADAVSAGAWGAFISSITGEYPEIIDNEDKTVTLVFSSSQASQMRSWLDGQLFSKEKHSVSVALRPVLTPWVLKYAVPIIAASLVLGFIAGKVIR